MDIDDFTTCVLMFLLVFAWMISSIYCMFAFTDGLFPFIIFIFIVVTFTFILREVLFLLWADYVCGLLGLDGPWSGWLSGPNLCGGCWPLVGGTVP